MITVSMIIIFEPNIIFFKKLFLKFLKRIINFKIKMKQNKNYKIRQLFYTRIIIFEKWEGL